MKKLVLTLLLTIPHVAWGAEDQDLKGSIEDRISKMESQMESMFDIDDFSIKVEDTDRYLQSRVAFIRVGKDARGKDVGVIFVENGSSIKFKKGLFSEADGTDYYVGIGADYVALGELKKRTEGTEAMVSLFAKSSVKDSTGNNFGFHCQLSFLTDYLKTIPTKNRGKTQMEARQEVCTQIVNNVLRTRITESLIKAGNSSTLPHSIQVVLEKLACRHVELSFGALSMKRD